MQWVNLAQCLFPEKVILCFSSVKMIFVTFENIWNYFTGQTTRITTVLNGLD